jgi:hypothetical protein
MNPLTVNPAIVVDHTLHSGASPRTRTRGSRRTRGARARRLLTPPRSVDPA